MNKLRIFPHESDDWKHFKHWAKGALYFVATKLEENLYEVDDRTFQLWIGWHAARSLDRNLMGFTGYVIEHADGTRWRTLDSIGMPDWTETRAQALCFRLREHAEIFACDDPEDIHIIGINIAEMDDNPTHGETSA